MAIYDGGGGTNVNGTTTTTMGGEEDTDNDGGIYLLPEEPGTFGSNGTLPIDLNITNTATSTNVTTTTTTTGLGIDASSVGVPYPSTLSPAPSTSSNINSTGARGAISQFMGDRLLQLVPPPEPQQRQQQQPPSTTPTVASDAAAAKVSFLICPHTILSFRESSPNDASSIGMPPIILETPAHTPIEIACLIAPSNQGTTATATTTTTTMNSGSSDSSGSGSSSSSRSCVMSGGDVHILMKYIPGYYTDDDIEMTGDNPAEIDNSTMNTTSSTSSSNTDEQQHYHPIIISGFTFRDASQASILMNYPHGNISFNDCAWENNSGLATMVIDGRYDDETLSSSGGDAAGGEEVVVGGDDLGVIEDLLGGSSGGEEEDSTSTNTGPNEIMSTTASTVNLANFILTTSATSFITAPPMLDSELSPFEIINDDDDQMVPTTESPPLDDLEVNNRELEFLDKEEEDVDEVDRTSRQAEE